MKKILYVLILVVVLLSCTGCAKVISEKKFTAEVTIKDTYYKGTYLQPILVGKVTSFITHPAKYITYIDYYGIEYQINDSSTYDYCDEHIGEKVTATFKTIQYDNGTSKNILLSIDFD